MKNSNIPQNSPWSFSEVKARGGMWYDDSGDKFRLRHSLNESECFMPHYHLHTAYEIHFVISGHTELACGTQTIELHAPYIAVHRPYIPHRLVRTWDDQPYLRFIANLPEDFLSAAMEWVPSIETILSHSFLALELTEEQCRRILPHIEDANRLYLERREDACRLAVALTLSDITEILPHCHIAAQEGRVQYLDEVIRFVIDHISERLLCWEVAARFFVSESKLALDFRKSFNLSFNQYVMQLRVKMAKDMLALGKSVAEVSEACGFCSTSYFSKVFRSYIGVTPGEYGKSLRK